MRSGKPVYVEKPMAISYSDCVAMNKVAVETRVPLFVAYYRRSLPYFIKIKELLSSNAIGQVLLVNVNLYLPVHDSDLDPKNLSWRVKPEIAGAGYFYDMACHQLDLLDFYFGPITEVSGVFGNRAGLYKAEDVVTASFKFQNGLPASGAWCFSTNATAKKDKIEIIGSEGKINFSTFAFSPIILENLEGKKEFNPENPENIEFFMIQDVVAELRGAGKSPSNGESAARTNHVMDIILDKVRHSQETCSRN
jgi:predicted dehydrogenase